MSSNASRKPIWAGSFGTITQLMSRNMTSSGKCAFFDVRYPAAAKNIPPPSGHSSNIGNGLTTSIVLMSGSIARSPAAPRLSRYEDSPRILPSISYPNSSWAWLRAQGRRHQVSTSYPVLILKTARLRHCRRYDPFLFYLRLHSTSPKAPRASPSRWKSRYSWPKDRIRSPTGRSQSGKHDITSPNLAYQAHESRLRLKRVQRDEHKSNRQNQKVRLTAEGEN